MKFGVFDHVDRGDLPLGQHYENRLRLTEVYDREGFHAYQIAEHHSTPLGIARLAQRVPLRGRAADQAASHRHAGLHFAAGKPAAPPRRSLHARPDEQWPARARRRPRLLALRARLFRRHRGSLRHALQGRLCGADAGPAIEGDRLRRAALSLQERAGRARMRAEADAADLVRPVRTRGGAVDGGERHQHRLQHRGQECPPRHRPLSRDLGRDETSRARAASADGHRPTYRGRRDARQQRSPAASAASIAGMRACSICGACTAIR